MTVLGGPVPFDTLLHDEEECKRKRKVVQLYLSNIVFLLNKVYRVLQKAHIGSETRIRTMCTSDFVYTGLIEEQCVHVDDY